MELPSRHIEAHSAAFSSYWQKKDWLFCTLGPGINRTNATALAAYYYQADDLGDAVAREYLISLGFARGMEKINEILKTYPQNKENYSAATREFMDQVFRVPDWVNAELLAGGSAFCNRSGTLGLATLRNYCLMGGYESAAINKPLIFTGALKKGAVKRLSDTIDFWIKVTASQGLQMRKDGFYSAIRTRLIHSYSRIRIEEQPQWQTESWGRPLNTWDMLATNLGFSIVFIDGLKKLGLRPSSLEIDGVLHLWKYVGYLLGIPEKLLVNTPGEAADALYYWSKTQLGADADSAALAHSLYQEPQQVTFTSSRLLKNFIQITNLGYNSFFLGRESSQKLKLPYSNARYWIGFLTKITQWQERFASPRSYAARIDKGHEQQLKVLGMYVNTPENTRETNYPEARATRE